MRTREVFPKGLGKQEGLQRWWKRVGSPRQGAVEPSSVALSELWGNRPWFFSSSVWISQFLLLSAHTQSHFISFFVLPFSFQFVPFFPLHFCLFFSLILLTINALYGFSSSIPFLLHSFFYFF